MAFALFRNESDQRLNVPIRTNTQRFCLVRTVHYQAKGFSSPRNPTRAKIDWRVALTHPPSPADVQKPLRDTEDAKKSTENAESCIRNAHQAPTALTRINNQEDMAGILCGCKGIYDPTAKLCQQNYNNVRYVTGDTRPEAPASVVADIPADKIVAVGGQGSLTVGIRLEPGVPERSAYVRVAGAEIETANGGQLDELGRLKVTARAVSDQIAYTQFTHLVDPSQVGGNGLSQLNQLGRNPL
jgi:hypothetical protein